MSTSRLKGFIYHQILTTSTIKHRHAKRAGVIFSIDWVAWGRTGC